ncbi:MAG TPA: winged helix-turn-helix domain-containing protein [Streptosporangiaceae bacterium]|jgi:DNA-binding winged helix-turn-helix (wHTH) protein|nr:winged helix-turn-helix domain-containing protein [Streptosporangiaceae bacterium]
MDYRWVSPGYVAVGTQLLTRPGVAERPDAEPGYSWDERVPPPGRDATLLAVVPIPGTDTSLAIVGYAIATTSGHTAGNRATGEQQHLPALLDQAAGHHGASGLLLNHGQRRVWAGGREIMLTFQEFELLAFLAAHPVTVFSRADLVQQVWRRGPASPARGDRETGWDARAVAQDSRTVDVHVSRLRHKLGPVYGQCLVTEYRVGYQFRPLPA